jgi:SagB-type dehydrogenase family enzyme
MAGIGDLFYQATKYSAGKASDYGPAPAAPLATVELPKPKGGGKAALAKLLASRRSRRKFTAEPIGIDDLSFLLWAADGIAAKGLPPHKRTAPSAGARHPIDTYCIVTHVEGLEKGLYRYRVEGHTLELVRKGDFERAGVKATAGQEWTVGTAVIFIWMAEFARTTSRYKDRGVRYVFLDAGHICQNLYLAAESLGLGMTAIAALDDDETNALVGADGTEVSIVYMAAVGKPAKE